MDRTVLFHLLYGITGLLFGASAVYTIVTEGFRFSSALLALSAGLCVASVVYTLTVKDRSEIPEQTSLLPVALAAALAVFGTVLLVLA
ncbi:hypothetical protein [Haloferax sp. DFSO60]|uniref:hypothetical protein n=1 Tax=Haloferax sp. DFSO60 TaxID=3388652 RepID=UPI0039792E6F